MSRPRSEDHPRVADELCRLLEPEFAVVAVVRDGRALRREVEAINPDVIVTDIAMPGLDGIAATSALLARRPGSRVVLITVDDDLELVERVCGRGALWQRGGAAVNLPGLPGRIAITPRNPEAQAVNMRAGRTPIVTRVRDVRALHEIRATTRFARAARRLDAVPATASGL